MRQRPLLVAICLFVSACSQMAAPAERRLQADEFASRHGWHPATLRTSSFDLRAYLQVKPPSGETLTVYIEGDGLAWIERSQPSTDPTPRTSLVLQLALAHPAGKSVYLARPCQYADAEKTGCAKRYWTDGRFSKEVIAATNSALDQLKQKLGATRLILVGYSGGGAVAALAATRRNDVVLLITVAGNLDHRAWTQYHRVAPLEDSLNPADEISALQKLSQLHFAGGKDRNITPELVLDFSRRFPEGMRPVVMIEPGFDHQCCWVDHWHELWRKVMDKPAN